jgi:hypothetical protein
LNHAGRRPTLDHLSASQSKALAASEAGFFIPRTGKPTVGVKTAQNPAPRSNFGFVDAFASMDTSVEFLDGFLVLKTNAESLSHVNDQGLPTAEVTQVMIDGPYLYAVTHGRGLWRRRYC